MDGNNKQGSNGKFVRSNDPDFYVPSAKRSQNGNNVEANRVRQNSGNGRKAPVEKKKPAKRNNKKPPYAGKKGGHGDPGRSTAAADRSPRRQPYGGSRRSIPNEKYREYMYQVRKKQVMRNRIIAGVVLSVLVIVAVVCSLSFTVWFRINELTLDTNDSAYSAKEISQASKINFGSDNLLRCDLEKIGTNIEKALPYIGKATARRKLPNTVVVDVEKTAAVAAVEHGRFVLLVNEEGKILQEVAEVPFGLTLVKYGKLNQINPGEIISSKNGVPASVYVSIIKSMHDNGLNDITVIDISAPDNVVLVYQDRIDIKLGRAEDINVKIGVAVKALTDEDKNYSIIQKGTLDLTYTEGHAYFIPYVEKEEETEKTEETTVTSVFDSPLKPSEDEQTKKHDDDEDDNEKVTEKKKEKTTAETATTKKKEEKTSADTVEEKTEKEEKSEDTSKATEKEENEKTSSEDGDNDEHKTEKTHRDEDEN